MDEEPSIMDRMVEEYGIEQADAFMKLMSAGASLLTIAKQYIEAPSGSLEETRAGVAYDVLIGLICSDPGKASEMMKTLVMAVLCQDDGTDLRTWFREGGVTWPL